MHFTEGKLGRIFILRMQDGDNLPDFLEIFAAEKEITSAICFFLGGAKESGKVVVGPENSNEAPLNPLIRVLNGIHEVCGIGTIFEDEKKKPKLHMHASFGRDNNSITGCIRMGITIWEIGEVILLEISNASAIRVMDQKKGFEFLEIS